MNKDFKKWLCDLAEMESDDIYPQENSNDSTSLKIIIKAMWAINRKESNIYHIDMSDVEVFIFDSQLWSRHYYYNDYNNSEKQALIKALEFIYEETK